MANPLAGSVTSLQSSIQLLGSSISILDTGVNDYPRLSKVLQTTRHFELLPETTLQSAQTSLLSSITPEIQSLLSRVETHVERLQRREQTLRAKSELLASRIGEQNTSGRKSRSGGTKSLGGSKAVDVGEEDSVDDVEAGREALRMRQLRLKKDRLSFAVERLTLQAQERERRLRKSMAHVEE